MILVMEMEKLISFTDEQREMLTTLTTKDQIYLITKTGDTLPVDLIPIINKISAKMEIRNLSDANSAFSKGFLYGALSSSSAKEKVVFFSSETAPENLSPNCSWNEGFADIKVKKKRTPSAKKNETPANAKPEESGKTEEKPADFQLTLTDLITEKPEKKPRTKKTSEPEITDLFSHPAIKAILPLIGDEKEALRKCIADSSDDTVGYKYMLQLRFKENGQAIWEKTFDKYDALKKLAKITPQY